MIKTVIENILVYRGAEANATYLATKCLIGSVHMNVNILQFLFANADLDVGSYFR